MSKKKRTIHARSKASRRRRRRNLCIKIGGSVIVLFLVVYFVMYRYVNKTDAKVIHDHIYIGETDVSGMNEEEAKQALLAKVEEYGEAKATIKVGEESTEATLQELGLSMNNVDKTVKQAISYGKQGSVWKRWNQIRKLKKENKVFDDDFALDTEKMSAVIAEKAQPLEVRAQNATIRHTGNGFEITDEVEGTIIDTNTSIEKLTEYLNTEWDYKDLEFEVIQTVEEPEIRREDLESIQDELGSFYTVAGSGTRVTNIARATELINGTVLMPGETYSVEQATVPYTEENGYVSGSAYENGQVVQNIGGGLCQVSTTLYNAVLYAELEIVTRSAHSMIVTYVEPSRDAAIAEGLKDLQFKNSYDTPILIEGYLDGSNNLWFHIYGKETRPSNRSVEYESETLEVIDYTTKYVADSGLTLGEMNSEGSKINGRVAKLWKVVYEDGKEVSRKVMNNSRYNASELKITVGTYSENSEASALVDNSIKTQDKSQIENAISQAKSLEQQALQTESGSQGE